MEPLQRLFRFFSATQCRGRSEVYEALSDAVAVDHQLLEMMMVAPPEQRRPSLLFACVNRLLADDPYVPLGEYYPIHGGARPVDATLAGAFSDFCTRHRAALIDLLENRSTQTNEVRRCIALLLGMEHVAARWPGPLNVVEIGASAGLNLLFDRYTYRIGGNSIDGRDSSVVITSELRGTGRLFASRRPAPTPPIRVRLGVDQAPVDLGDREARRWLEAFIWPEHVSDLATLRAAVETSRADESELELVVGDAVTDTARLVSEVPGKDPVLIFTASLLSYLSPSQRQAFAAQVEQAADRRRVAWVFAEAPGLVASTGLDCPALSGPLGRVGAVYSIGVSASDSATRHDTMLALADPYLRWVAPAQTPNDSFDWAAADGLF